MFRGCPKIKGNSVEKHSIHGSGMSHIDNFFFSVILSEIRTSYTRPQSPCPEYRTLLISVNDELNTHFPLLSQGITLGCNLKNLELFIRNEM